MSKARRLSAASAALAIAVVVAIGWGCRISVQEILKGIETGVLLNRKAPDVHVANNPIMFWALIAFYSVAVLTAVGAAAYLLMIVAKGLFGRRD